MVVRQPISESSARMWVGHLVCVALKDGSYYVGRVAGVDNNEIVLAGVKGDGKISANPRQADKAKISGLLGSLFGGGGGAFPSPAFGAGAGAVGGGAIGNQPASGPGFFGKMWPGIRLGLGVLQFIWPLIGRFLI